MSATELADDRDLTGKANPPLSQSEVSSQEIPGTTPSAENPKFVQPGWTKRTNFKETGGSGIHCYFEISPTITA